jgi:serine/threonine-protein kinase
MATPQTLEMPGYQVVQFLGSGARSTIWQVRDERTNELFAVKRVVVKSHADARFIEQAINEYNIASRLDHPVIRKVYRLRRVRRWLRLREVHILMELCEGRTVQDERPESVVQAVRIFCDVAAALAYMNARGFVHADMKPNNIIVAPDGRVKIIDLGQSCPLGTIKERIQGTPDFMAPEQVHRRPLDGRTDVYNFGAALYWTLTGRPIPTIMPRKDGMTLMVELAIPAPEQLNRDVPAPLSKLVIDCVDMQPSRRPASMAEVGSRMNLMLHTMNRKPGNGKGPQG